MTSPSILFDEPMRPSRVLLSVGCAVLLLDMTLFWCGFERAHSERLAAGTTMLTWGAVSWIGGRVHAWCQRVEAAECDKL
jgi:hypothetical protein